MATFRPPLVIAVKHSLLSCFESTVTKSPTLKNPGSGSRIMRTTEPFSTFCIITSALWSHVLGVSQSAPCYLFQVWWSQWQGNLLSCPGTKSVQLPCLLLNFSRSHKHYVRMCNISQLSVPYHDSIQTLYSAATTLLSHLFQKAKLQTETTKRLISWRMRSWLQ